MTKLKPIGDRIIFKPAKTEEKIGSIFIPQNATERPSEGEVVAIGPLVINKALTPGASLSVGDKVIVSKYCGTEIKVDGEEFRIVEAKDIMAVIKN